jgi:hypothetical protein
MEHMSNKKSVDFFENQFQRQVRGQDYALNPFEILALDYVKGFDPRCRLWTWQPELGGRTAAIVSYR